MNRRWPGPHGPDQRPRIRVAVVLVAATLVATVAACTRPSQRPAGTPGRPPTARLVAADPHGAVLLDERGQYVGVTRDGSIAWREPAGVRTYRVVSCLARCPDAVLSASLDAANAAAIADPVPRLVVGGQWRPLDALVGTKRRILTAESVEEFVLAGGEPAGGGWIEMHHPGVPVRRLPVGGFDSSWQRSADSRHALVITSVVGDNVSGNEARWLTHTGPGWRPVGAVMRVTGVTACVTPDGSRALLLGQRPAVLDRDGNQRSLTDLDSAGACAWARSGGIVAELSAAGDGLRSRVRVVDDEDAVRWWQDVAGEVSVTADPTGSRVAYQADRVLHEIDTQRGVELRTIPGVQAARYDAHGDLVTIADDGAVRWRR